MLMPDLKDAIIVACREIATGEVVDVIWKGRPLAIAYHDIELRVVPPRGDGTWMDEPPRRCGAPFLEE